MVKNISANEETRRKLNRDFDTKPSIHHIYNYTLSKKFLKNKKILDIGCWTGQFIQLLQNDSKFVFGIDPGSDAIRYAQKRFPKFQLKIASVQKLPYKDEFFDVVTLLEVIEHLPKETVNQSLLEINRVLKNNGVLILSTPSNHPLSIILDPAYFLIGHRHYSIAKISELLKSHGFKIIEVKVTGGLFRLTSLLLDSIAKHALKTTITYPDWVLKIIEAEYKRGGFAQLHFVARKIS